MPEAFAPTEHVDAISARGEPAADYDIILGGRVVGQAQVWSRGAFRRDDRTMIHVGFHLESNTESALTLDLPEVSVDRLRAGDRSLAPLVPSHVRGSTRAEPGGETSVNVYFTLPADVKPQSLDAFRITWRLKSGTEQYTQRTPFLEEVRPAYDPRYSNPYYYGPYYYGPYYDPWYDGPMGSRAIYVRP